MDPHYVGPHYVIVCACKGAYCTSILSIAILQPLVYTKYHAPVGAWCESKCIVHLHKLSPPSALLTHCTLTTLALVITGLLGEGHQSDVFKVEASVLQVDNHEDDGDEVPTTLMALKVSSGPDGLAALQSEYHTYRHLAKQEHHRRNSSSSGGHKGSDLVVPRAYRVF